MNIMVFWIVAFCGLVAKFQLFYPGVGGRRFL
jgi:hypothetical protein